MSPRKRLFFAGIALISSLAAAVASPQAGASPRTASAAGVSIKHPAEWRHLQRSDGAIDLLSPGEGAEGVVIAKGQAEILVTPVVGFPATSLAGAADADVSEMQVLSRKLFPAASSTSRSCGPITDVEALDEVGPGAKQRLTLLYCQTGARAWRILERSWANDPRRRHWRSIAIALARSLVADPASETP